MNRISLFKRQAKSIPLVNIQNIRIASPCPADWNKMIGDERVRHCSDCNLNVYNLSAMTEREVQKLIAGSNGRLCTRFYRRTDGTILTQDCPRGMRAVAQRVSRVAAAVLSAVMSVSSAMAGTKPQQCPPPARQNENKGPGVAIAVTDPQGAVLSGAPVTLVRQDGKKAGMRKVVMTDSAGRVFVSDLPTGKYELEVKFQGFKTFHQIVPVREGKLESITLKLQVSESGMVIVGDLASGPELIQKESTVTTTFDRSFMDLSGSSRGGVSPIRQ